MKLLNGCIAALLASAPLSNAYADCHWYEFGCKAADVGGQHIEEASKNVRDAALKGVNYWGYLLEKYHAGSPEEKSWAKKIIQGELGIDPDAVNISKQFEIAITFTGLKTDKRPIDVAVLEDSADEPAIKATIEAGTRDAMSDFRRVDWPINVVAESTAVNFEDIRKLLKERMLRGPEVSKKPCTVTGYSSPPNCIARLAEQKALDVDYQVDLLILALNPNVSRKAGVETRFAWLLNPELTVLIPKHELDAQPNLEMAVSVYRVLENGTREPTRRFAIAHKYTHLDLTAGSTLYTSRGKYVDGDSQYFGRRIEIYSP